MEQEQMQEGMQAAPAQAKQPQQKPGGPDPKTKEVFQRLLLAAMKYIYSEAVTPNLMQMVQSAKTPFEGVANATKAVVSQIAGKAKGLPPEVANRVAPMIAMLIAEIAVKAGLMQDSPESKQQILAALQGGGQPAPQEQAQPQEQPQQPQGLVAAEMGA